MATLVKTERGKENLQTGNYIYNFHSNSKDMLRKYWRCVERSVCNGRCTTYFNTDGQITVMKESNHVHEPRPADVIAREIASAIRVKAENLPNETPNSIFLQETQEISDEEILQNLPEKHTLYRVINRAQNKSRPALPRNMEDLQILSPYDTTLNGDQFLQHDIGLQDPNRIIIFYSDSGIKNLIRSRSMFCDGTFKTVPRMFYQLYTLHAIINGYVYPVMYILCSNKSNETYTLIFEHLKNMAVSLEEELRPSFIIMDLELAAINAARTIFPLANIHTCMFHLNQAIWRKAVDLGLKIPFSQNEGIRNNILKLFALAFIPLQDLTDVFTAVVEECHESLYHLCEYIDHTYIRGKPQRGRRLAVPPRYSPVLWNVYQLTLLKMQRTNNIVEGWNSRFQKLINAHHATIWKFLDHIKKDQRQNEVLIVQSLGGHKVKKPISNRSLLNQRQIEEIVNRYEERKANGEIGPYLLSLSRKLKLYTFVEEEENNID